MSIGFRGIQAALALAGYFLMSLGSFASPAYAASSVPDDRVALSIYAGTLIPGNGQTALKDVIVRIEDGKITSIMPDDGAPIPENGNVIDARDKFLVPGIVEAHAHIDHTNGLGLSPEEKEQARAYNPVAMLYHGITTVLNMSSHDYEWVSSLRTKAEAGAVLPRILTGENHFTTNGGWGGRHGGGLTSTEEINERLEHLKAIGVDLVKIIYEDGLGPEPVFKRLEAADAKAITERAHELGLPVFIHATDEQEYLDALSANPDAMAHGLTEQSKNLDAITAKLVEQGNFVVPTIVLFEAMTRFLDNPDLLNDPALVASTPDFVLDSLRAPANQVKAYAKMDEILNMDTVAWAHEAVEILKANTRAFARAGVPLAVGADSGGAVPFALQGYNTVRELELLAACCLSAGDTIKAASLTGARIMGLQDRFGALEPGRSADILILDANPLEDISNYRKFETMVLRGQVISRNSLTFKAFQKRNHEK